MLPNMNLEQILLEYEYEYDIFSIRNGYEYKQIIDSCLRMSQLYNGREINILI
jgi:hypothetical protein